MGGADLLDAKFSNPVLGLIGTYAYLLRGDIDPQRLMLITGNLLRLLPHSPDAHLLYRLAEEASPDVNIRGTRAARAEPLFCKVSWA
jgi:hypothetical protein